MTQFATSRCPRGNQPLPRPPSATCPGRALTFQCPRCSELRATVNPRNNLAHCFRCGENFNNIDLMMIQGHDFLLAVDILKAWLAEYQRDLGRSSAPAQPAAS